MNIVCLSIHSSPLGRPGTKDTGGMSTYLRELSSALGRLGHRVDMFTASGETERESIVTLETGVRLITIPIGCGSVNKLGLYPHLGRVAEEAKRLCRKENSTYDLIFSHYWLSGLVGQRLKKVWGVPHLIMFHTLGAVKNGFCSAENEPELRLRAEQKLITQCDRVIVATQREREELCNYYQARPEKISIIPCGVNLNLFKPLAPKQSFKRSARREEKIILYVGRIEPIKGLDLLLRAAACLRIWGYNFKLFLAGGDRHSSRLRKCYRQLARELGLDEQVVFLGLVEHSVLPQYYSLADVTVVPSYYESFGMTALESLACGTPVVATDVGDLKQIFIQGRTGYVIAERTPEELAKAMIKIFSLPQKPAELCRNTVLSFGWPEIARQMIEEFGKIASEEEHSYG